jgi:hypothetical protein
VDLFWRIMCAMDGFRALCTLCSKCISRQTFFLYTVFASDFECGRYQIPISTIIFCVFYLIIIIVSTVLRKLQKMSWIQSFWFSNLQTKEQSLTEIQCRNIWIWTIWIKSLILQFFSIIFLIASVLDIIWIVWKSTLIMNILICKNMLQAWSLLHQKIQRSSQQRRSSLDLKQAHI